MWPVSLPATGTYPTKLFSSTPEDVLRCAGLRLPVHVQYLADDHHLVNREGLSNTPSFKTVEGVLNIGKIIVLFAFAWRLRGGERKITKVCSVTPHR